ncbi:hypothetical protein D3C71_1654280 [compost metagenome]
MHDVVVIGKAQAAAVRAEHVYVSAATQCTRRIRGSDVHRIKGNGQFAVGFADDHPAAMVKIVMPDAVRVFRPMNESIAGGFIRADGHYTNVGALLRAIHDFDYAGIDIHPLDAQTGEGGTVRAYVVSQPLAVRCPDINIG